VPSEWRSYRSRKWMGCKGVLYTEEEVYGGIGGVNRKGSGWGVLYTKQKVGGGVG